MYEQPTTSLNTAHGASREGVGLIREGTKRKLPLEGSHPTLLLLFLLCKGSVQSASVIIAPRAWH